MTVLNTQIPLDFQQWRFWIKVQKSKDGCWEWTGGLSANKRYGNITIKGTQYPTHRVAYAIKCGQPGELQVLHKCDNTKCVRPDHLFLGTNQDNVDDKLAKGRQPRGETHGRTTTSLDQVRQIRRLKDEGIPLSVIQNTMPLHHSTTEAIYSGRNWKGIE